MACPDIMPEPRMPDRAVIVIFGGSGDLTRRKILPAFRDLGVYGNLPPECTFVAAGRKNVSDAELRDTIDASADFKKNIHYVRIPSYDGAACHMLQERVTELTGRPLQENNYLFYLAVPPQSFVSIARGLKESGWTADPADPYWTRLVVEKPYGRDHASALELNRGLLEHFCEKQIYRIDHYLGKEAVQNLLVFRFANLIFEPLWNNNYIDNIQISGFERIGVGHRGDYYDTYGVTRDMMQNHLMQLLTLVAMEPPVSLDPDDVRNAKVNVLRQIRPICFDGACRMHVRGQYGPSADGQLPGYRQEPGVPARSGTETFAALKLYVDNSRWHGVPFYLRSGKRLDRQGTMIVVQFKELPRILYNGGHHGTIGSNRIIFEIQPDAGVLLEVANKNPGHKFSVRHAGLDFYYRSEFKNRVSEAYERLLLDALWGANTLFVRSDETELSWQLFDPLLRAWQDHPDDDFPNYPAGSTGPAAADDMLKSDGRVWVGFDTVDGYRD